MLNLKNLQACARRRGLSLGRERFLNMKKQPADRPFVLIDPRWPDNFMEFEDLGEVRDELRVRPIG